AHAEPHLRVAECSLHVAHTDDPHPPVRMTNETLWIIARASGTASLIALAVSLLSGMALRSGVLGRLAHNRAVSELHSFSNALWLPLGLVHVVALLFDRYAQIRPIDLVIPFAVP